ncbi:hypothetical protein FB451DRAFT_1491471 [Mycena latifolia]|nr:hypothetical protein FB451DRAFT_1491471 [Mycena latifolia]
MSGTVNLPTDTAITVFLLFAVSWITFGWALFHQGLPTLPWELLSKITTETPISGFYGPGSWLAWLITLGMSHGNMIKALWTTGALPKELDYNLIGASTYIVAAAIDLIGKSRAIAQLGDAAGTSILLLALACAEFVVWLGAGFSLISMVTALFFGRVSGLRIAGIAGIPLIRLPFFGVAHDAIQPPGTCDVVLGTHFPASITTQWKVFPTRYWIWAGTITGAVIAVVFVWEISKQRTLRRVPWDTIIAGSVSAVPVSFPRLYLAFMDTMWFMGWVVFWWPVYILAFFPEMGYFPITGISVLEMDQIAALLDVAVVAAIRILRTIVKAIRPPEDSDSTSLHEVAPLLPVSSGDQ